MSDLIGLLGLTEYEGRVYRALLAESPATAYRLGKTSGVPLSRVYEIVNRLVSKGAATAIPGDPLRYEPVDPSTLVAEAKARAVTQLEALRNELTTAFRSDSAPLDAWIQGEEAVLARLAVVTAAAERQVLVACAPYLVDRLRPHCAAAKGALRDFLPVNSQGEAFSALIDGQVAVIGSIGPAARAFVSREPSFITHLQDYFRSKMRAESAMPSARPQPPVDLHADWLDWEREKQDRLLGIRIPVRRD